MTPDTFDEMADVIAEAITAAVAPLLRRIEELERRPELKYVGVWELGAYSKNQAVTHSGSLWICKVDRTLVKPGQNGDWQLAVKRGADGKDAR